MQRNGYLTRFSRAFALLTLAMALMLAAPVMAAPYAAMVIDARSGKVLHSRNADTRLHPASLTKMMTLYVAFEAVQNGEMSMDTLVTISRKAAAEPPSKLGLRAGQRIKMRYLVRAAAVRSANDAATAIAEAVSGSEAAFARRMNRTAKALGMNSTTFKNAHGLTQSGHMSTARDMTTMGRALFYHYPQYYNLFSRKTTDAGLATVRNTNRRMLTSYRGADGIKTGYTRAAGFNLVSSAERNGERIIATIFGGNSGATRDARMVELLNMGFERAPRRVAVSAPPRPTYRGNSDGRMPGKTVRVVRAVTKSLRPMPRPGPVAPPEEVLIALQDSIDEAVSVAATLVAEVAEAPSEQVAEAVQPPGPLTLSTAPEPLQARPVLRPDMPDDQVAVGRVTPELPGIGAQEQAPGLRPKPRPLQVRSNLLPQAQQAIEPIPALPPLPTRVVTRADTKATPRGWSVSLGRYPTRFAAEQALLEAALREMSVLSGAKREIVRGSRGFEAGFRGLSQAQAERTCGRMAARGAACEIGQTG